jgi:hypothetical protein
MHFKCKSFQCCLQHTQMTFSQWLFKPMDFQSIVYLVKTFLTARFSIF